jgi:hypothetical protein
MQRKLEKRRSQQQSASQLLTLFLTRRFFCPEDGDDTFLRNGFSKDKQSLTFQKTAFFSKKFVCKGCIQQIGVHLSGIFCWLFFPNQQNLSNSSSKYSAEKLLNKGEVVN